MVIVCHFVEYGLPVIPRWLRLVPPIGGTGVDLFFVLSGFLITRILVEARGRPGFLRNFYARRVLRIFPLYYGFLFVLLFAGPLPPFHTAIWSWTYTQDIAMTFFPSQPANLWQWTPHLWSLAVEEQFYLIWPFIVKFAAPRRLPMILLGTIPFAILSRALLLWSGHGPGYMTACHVDALGMGSLLAVVAVEERKVGWVLLLALPAWIGGVFLFSGTALPVVQLLKSTGTALVYAVVLLLVVKAKTGGVLSHPVLMTIGRYSYGMYVLHLTILGFVNPRLSALWPPLAFAVVFTAIMGAAALSWHLYEQPFLRLKTRFSY